MYRRIRALREDRDISQKTVAEYLKCSQVCYSYYEIGRRDIPTDILMKLADYYKTSIDYLFGRTDQKNTVSDVKRHISYNSSNPGKCVIMVGVIKMVSFESDYNNGACPEVLRRLISTNGEVHTGYMCDDLCSSAREKIKKACGTEDIDIYFSVGGTQANALVIGSVLANHEGVVAAKTGHISLHEGGAIEYSGHKVLELPHENGKVTAAEFGKYMESFYADENFDKMVFPGMLYISHPTEYGTLYTKAELTELKEICRRYGMKLYLDGARLGYGLMADGADVTLPDIAEICDIFYIGGTKVGALCGEAIVFTKGTMPAHFNTVARQRLAMIAKGRLLGAQFDALFTGDTYFKISAHAIKMAAEIKRVFTEKGYRLFLDSPTNQQFVILENGFMDSLRDKVGFCFWEKHDENHTVVRFASSWATAKEDIAYLDSLL